MRGGNPRGRSAELDTTSLRAEAAAVRTPQSLPAEYSHEGWLVTQTDFNLFLRLTQVIKRLQKPVEQCFLYRGQTQTTACLSVSEKVCFCDRDTFTACVM